MTQALHEAWRSMGDEEQEVVEGTCVLARGVRGTSPHGITLLRINPTTAALIPAKNLHGGGGVGRAR
jgi:hypothetical protein